MKNVDIKIKYSSKRVKAIQSVLTKRGSTLEKELTSQLEQLYIKIVKLDVREFIEELENNATNGGL